jgi:hypothetical protein
LAEGVEAEMVAGVAEKEEVGEGEGLRGRE